MVTARTSNPFATRPYTKTVEIKVSRRRYRCQDCGKTLFDPIPDLDSKRFATTHLVAYVRTACFRETFAAVARRVAMD
jgi:transposase